MAVIIAERLNRSTAPCVVLIPLKGWSFLDKKGRSFYDPEANGNFVEELKRRLKPEIPIIEMDYHLNTPEFGREAVELFHQLFTQWYKGKP
jgi:uncharacterized protein (UPF0261 family)